MRHELLKSNCPFCGEPVYFKQEDGAFCCFSCFKNGQDLVSEMCGLKEPAEQSKILDEAASYFQKSLWKCSYATKRGLNREIAARFRLGYADGTLTNYLLKKKYSEEEIVAAGLAKQVEDGSLTDVFKKRLMFPIMTSQGVVVGFGGRKIDDLSPAPKYLNSIETDVFFKKNHLYGLNDCKKFTTIYLVEGYMDVVSLHKAGVTNAVAALGTAVGKNHALLLKGLGTKRVVIALDNDEAGQKAIKRAIPILKEYFEIEVLSMQTSYKDADEYLKSHSAEEFYNLKTIPANEFLLKNSALDIDTILATL